MPIHYREDFKCWWPDYDHKPEACFSKVKRRLPDVDITAHLAESHDVVVQAGGHAGFWPMRLAAYFQKVFTFECEGELYQCMLNNTAHVKNIHPSCNALGATVGRVNMRAHVSAGSWRIDPKGKFAVNQVTIDSLVLPSCGAIILDVEGYELECLKGAARTIERFSPVLHVEEGTGYEEFMAHMNYRPIRRVHADRIYVRG